ncbi:N-acetylmuramoyl-L-alanine amidase [Microvirga terricola]|uniref:N-acetylmuramoyl-L-alanine amidase n=1 Tax=Microvirga terricola TaxID=2719797 RepID=A0ABX0VA42_9HYPH|nr:N-acetylmuramoyl-L-alanine amidase [Microvirga terricola]NIX76413.1 N-acetylmuramoyl-L-alanine amidase [Microvirga terricola]
MNAPLSPESPVAAKVFPSPNHGERKNGQRPNMVVLHYTGMPDEGEALQWLCNPVSQVSAHYFVFSDGRVLQLVPESRRAWHAGASSWEGETDINSCSIGIEIANAGHPGGLPAYPDVQMQSVIALTKDIVTRWRIPATRVLGHSDVAPGRKVDPGEVFPWGRLHEAGIGHWVPAAPMSDGRFFSRGDEGMPIEALQAMLAMYGYGVKITGVFDEITEKVVSAFQRHFRPERVDGVADASTITTLRNLIAKRPASVAA